MLWVETANQIDTQVGTPPPSPYFMQPVVKENGMLQDQVDSA